MKFEYKHKNIECLQDMLIEHNIDMEVIQISSGAYCNNVSAVILPTLRLSRITKNKTSTTVLHGVIPKDEFVIMIPLDNAYTKINGIEILPGGFNITAPNEVIYMPADINTSDNSISINISKQALEAYLGKKTTTYLIKKIPTIRTQQNNSKHFRKNQVALSTYIAQVINASISFNLQTIKDIEDTIYHYIIILLSEFINDIKIVNSSFNNHLAIINRVMEFVNSTSEISINKPLILQHAFCSARTLDYAFQSILGVSFKKYLILRRMTLIKKELLHHPEKNIKNIVSKYGIVNLGRFSSDFNALFGQYPKQMMQQNKLIY